MRRLLVLLLLAPALHAQAPSDPSYQRRAAFASPHALLDSLGRLAARPDAAARTAALDRLWSDLRAKGQVPFAVGDSVVWLFRGEAQAVAWAGDMNGWAPRWSGQRLAGTDLWWRRDRLPADARFDYKVVLNGSDWQQDPANPLAQYSGTGSTNSELRMPAYRYPRETLPRAGRTNGLLSAEKTLSSAVLGYAVRYRVYTPAGYAQGRTRLPLLVTTDGHEFAHPALGALVNVLDNTIAAGQVAPVVVVFVDPRDPATGRNRRQAELVPPGGQASVCNPCQADRFLDFLSRELVPAVEAAYRTRPDAEGRAILGTSLGGLFAAYAATTRPDVFRHAAVFSPAFWVYPALYARVAAVQPAGQRLFLAQGTVGDGDGGNRLADTLNARGYAYTYLRRNEGHSWGHWRAIEGTMLRLLFPAQP